MLGVAGEVVMGAEGAGAAGPVSAVAVRGWEVLDTSGDGVPAAVTAAVTGGDVGMLGVAGEVAMGAEGAGAAGPADVSAVAVRGWDVLDTSGDGVPAAVTATVAAGDVGPAVTGVGVRLAAVTGWDAVDAGCDGVVAVVPPLVVVAGVAGGMLGAGGDVGVVGGCGWGRDGCRGRGSRVGLVGVVAVGVGVVWLRVRGLWWGWAGICLRWVCLIVAMGRWSQRRCW